MSFFKDFVTVVDLNIPINSGCDHGRRSLEKVRSGYQTKQKLERPRKSSYKQEEQIKSCGEKTRSTVVSFNQIRHEVSSHEPISQYTAFHISIMPDSSPVVFTLPITPRAPVPRASHNMKTTGDESGVMPSGKQT